MAETYSKKEDGTVEVTKSIVERKEKAKKEEGRNG